MATATPPDHKLTRRELDEYKRKLAETTDLAEKVKIVKALSERVARDRQTRMSA
jgi:hypothetical protein